LSDYNSIRCAIIQPAVPTYRSEFFDDLRKELSIDIYASDIDFLGVNSDNNIHFFKIGRFIKFFSLFWHSNLPIFRIIKNYNLIILNGNPRILNYMILFFLCKITHVKVIWWGHGWTGGSRGLSALIRRHIMQYADTVWLYTKKEADEFKSLSIVGLGNGVPFSWFDSNPYISKIGNNLKIQLLFVGRITPKANLEVIIRALSLLDNRFSLVVIGAGSHYEECKSLCSSLNLNTRISFLGPIYNHEIIKKYFKDSDLFVYGGDIGLSLIHSFSQSLPVIIHDDFKSHMPEISAFSPNSHGFVFKKNNFISLQKAILRYSELSVLNRRVMRCSCYATAYVNYNTRAMSIIAIKSIKRLFRN